MVPTYSYKKQQMKLALFQKKTKQKMGGEGAGDDKEFLGLLVLDLKNSECCNKILWSF